MGYKQEKGQKTLRETEKRRKKVVGKNRRLEEEA